MSVAGADHAQYTSRSSELEQSSWVSEIEDLPRPLLSFISSINMTSLKVSEPLS